MNDKLKMKKLREYVATGTPTVAFDLRETRHSAQNAALYVTPNDVNEFAQRVNHLLDHPQERRRLGQIGRRRVQECLAWEYSAETLRRAYAFLLARRQETA